MADIIWFKISERSQNWPLKGARLADDDTMNACQFEMYLTKRLILVVLAVSQTNALAVIIVGQFRAAFRPFESVAVCL